MTIATFYVMDEAEIDRVIGIVKNAYTRGTAVDLSNAMQALNSLKRAHFGPNEKMDGLRQELEAERAKNANIKDLLHSAESRIDRAQEALDGRDY